MSLNRRIAVAVFANYASRVVQIVLSLTLLPLMFRYLSQEEIGVWMLVGQSALFIGLLDFGFGPTLTRRIAFAKGASGADVEVELGAESCSSIAALVGTGRILYRYLAVAVFLGAAATGAFFLSALNLKHLPLHEAIIAWLLICVSYGINTWASFWFCLLGGLGYVGSVSFIGMAFQVGGLLAKIAVVVAGGGLLELALVECVVGLASRQAMLLYLRRREPQLQDFVGQWSHEDFRSMLSPAVRCWLTTLGAFLILNTDQYFIAYFEGADMLPKYQAAYSVISNLFVIAMSFSVASNVFYSQLWRAGDLAGLHRLLFRNVHFALGVMVCGSAAVIFSSPALFDLWLGEGHFIGFPILLIFCLMLTLEAQHVTFVFPTRASEDEAFAAWALGAGALNLVLTWLLIRPLGLLGVALGTFIAQLLTNNWYVIYRSHRRLSLSLRSYVRESLVPTAGLAVLNALPLLSLVWLGWLPTRPWPRVVVVCLWCGLLLATYLWMHALSGDERRRLKQRAIESLPYRWRPA